MSETPAAALCRYCSAPVDPALPRALCRRCHDRLELHRLPPDERDCSDCGRRAVVQYRCTACESVIEVDGAYRWHWQGKGHWHVADDEAALDAHIACGGVVLPVR